jgi:uncharacterized membrane protein
MSGKADTKHTAALVVVAVGAVVVLVGAGAGVAAINADSLRGWFVCTVCCVVGFFVIRRGLNLRNAAVAEGSTLIEQMQPPDGTGRTTHTETRKPTFLRKKEEEAEEAEE